MWFVLKRMDFILKVMDFILKVMDFIAYWRMGSRGMMERLRDIGANPTAVAQTSAQVQSGAAGDTPLGVSNPGQESQSARAQWRVLFCDVFGLPAPAADALIEPAPAPLGLPPAANAPEPAGCDFLLIFTVLRLFYDCCATDSVLFRCAVAPQVAPLRAPPGGS